MTATSGSRSRSSAAAWPGPSLAARLARAGHQVVVLERSPAWALAGRWRVRLAGRGRRPGAGPASTGDAGRRRATHPGDARRDARRDDVPADLRRGRGRPSRRSGSTGRGSTRPCSSWPRCAGAEVRRGWQVTDGRCRTPGARRAIRMGRTVRLQASVVVGADGPHPWSRGRPGVRSPGPPRTAGRPDLSPAPIPARSRPRDARMRVLDDGYVGIAPVARRTGQRRDRARPVVASGPRGRRRPADRRPHRGRDPARRGRPGRLAHGEPTDRRGRRLAARSPGDAAGRARLAARRRRGRLPRSVHR